MEEYYQLMLALRNMESIFEYINDNAKVNTPIQIPHILGGRKHIYQCLKDILTYLKQIEKIFKTPIKITTSLKLDIMKLRDVLNQCKNGRIELGQLKYMLERCYSIRTKLQSFPPLLSLPLTEIPIETTASIFPQKPIGFVLYVEPEKVMRHQVKQILVSDQWRVKTAENAEVALQIIAEETPDIILSAVMLPSMNGFEFVKKLRSISTTSHLPIILLTSRTEEDRVKGLQLGAEDYITKPFSVKELCMRMRIHRELSHLRIQSEQIAKNRELLLDNLCHELRNPLQGIYGYAEFLQESLDEMKKLMETAGVTGDVTDNISITFKQKLLMQLAAIQEPLASIKHCVNHQKSVTEDMLQLSKLDAKKIELNPTRMRPKLVIDKIVSMLSSEIQRKKIQLSVHVSNISDVFADTLRLSQILLNLMTNAIKFTKEKGSIVISARTIDSDETQVKLAFSVRDDGIGMSIEEQERLFDRYSQANRKTYEKYGGIGLGLQISKSLIELMGGKIEVKSSLGKGSTFSFTTICQPAPLLTVETNKETPLSVLPTHKKKNAIKLHVLIVEDNIINQKLLVKQLEKEGYKCSVADNGEMALKRIEENKGKNIAKAKTINVVLMDIEMPIMDGITATREQRSREAKYQLNRLPIIGVSGNATNKHRDQAMKAGMNDYITKPYKIENLKKIITKCTSHENKTILSTSSFHTLKPSLNSHEALVDKPSSHFSNPKPINPPEDNKKWTTLSPLQKSFSPTIQATVSPDKLYRNLRGTNSFQPRSFSTTNILNTIIPAAVTTITPITQPTMVFSKITIPPVLAKQARSLIEELTEQLYKTYPFYSTHFETIRKTYLALIFNYHRRLELMDDPRQLITEKDLPHIKNILKQLKQPSPYSSSQFLPRLSLTDTSTLMREGNEEEKNRLKL